MGFFRRLFGGRGQGDREGVYFYIRSDRTGEVIRVRLHRFNDLSLTDDGTYYVRKVIVGQKSFDRIEAQFYFNKNRDFTSADVTGGKLVDEKAFEAYQAASENA